MGIATALSLLLSFSLSFSYVTTRHMWRMVIYMGNFCFVFVISHNETHLGDGVGDNYCFKASVVDPEVKIYMKSEEIISICKLITFQPL